MAVAIQIFFLSLVVVIVKGRNPHNSHNRHDHNNHHGHYNHHDHHNDFPNFLDNMFHPGIFGVGLFGSGMFGNGGSRPDGYVGSGYNNNYNGNMGQDGNYRPINNDYEGNMGQEGNYAPTGTDYEDFGQYGGNNIGVNVPDQSNVNIEQPDVPQIPDVNFNIEIPNVPSIPDVQDLNSNANSQSLNEVPLNSVNVPVNTNGQSSEQNADINQSQLNMVPNNVEGPNINADTSNTAVGNGLSGLNPQNNPEEKTGDLIDHKVPAFIDDNIKEGIVMADPELKYNINESHEPKISGEIQGQPASVDAGLNPTVEVQEKTHDSIGNEGTIPGFNDNDVKKGILSVDPELKYNINKADETKVPDMNIAEESTKNNPSITTENSETIIGKIPGSIGDNISIDTPSGEPKLSYNINGSQFPETVRPTDQKKAVPGFDDDDIKKGVLMIDPELKHNDSDVGLNKNSDAVVFPDDIEETKKQNQVGSDVQQNLPERFSAEDNQQVVAPAAAASSTNYVPSQSIAPNNYVQIITPASNNQGELNPTANQQVVAPTNAASSTNYVPSQSIAPNSYVQIIPSSNNQGEQNPTTNQQVVAPAAATSSTNYVPSQSIAPNSYVQIIPASNNQGEQNPTTNQQVIAPTAAASSTNYVPSQSIAPNNYVQIIPSSNNQGEQNPTTNQQVVAPAAATSSTNYVPSQSIAPNNYVQIIPESSSQSTKNPTSNQPSSVLFVQNPNQQVPVNNKNESPYINVVRNQNGDYTVVNIPNNNAKPGQIYKYVMGNGDSAVKKPIQVYVSGNSGSNSPSQNYVSGNSGVNNPSQIYVPVNGKPGQTYVMTGGTNSGVSNPGQVYVLGNSENNVPGQIYVPGNSGANNPGQIYVSNNVPSSGSQTTSGGYYNVIQLSDGQTVLVPVNNNQNGNGQNAQWNGQSNNGQIYVPVDYNPGQVLGNNLAGNVGSVGSSGTPGNVVTGGPTNNVPLLISYKDKDGEDEEKSAELDQTEEVKEE